MELAEQTLQNILRMKEPEIEILLCWPTRASCPGILYHPSSDLDYNRRHLETGPHPRIEDNSKSSDEQLIEDDRSLLSI